MHYYAIWTQTTIIECLQQAWANIDTSKYIVGIYDQFIVKSIDKDIVLHFEKDQII